MSREAVAAPSLAVFKARLDRGLEQAALVEGVPAHGRDWSLMSFKVSPNPNHSGIGEERRREEKRGVEGRGGDERKGNGNGKERKGERKEERGKEMGKEREKEKWEKKAKGKGKRVKINRKIKLLFDFPKS